MNGLETMTRDTGVAAIAKLVADAKNAGEYLVNISTNEDAEIGIAWQQVTATSHQEAAIEALRSCINFYAPFGTVYARVHGPNDAKHNNGNPALIHTFTLRIGGGAHE